MSPSFHAMRSVLERYSLASFVMAAGLAVNLTAQAAVVSSADFAAAPPVITQSATPLVMLTMSNDHQLYYKAYTDWDDLDGDGDIENTYDHSIDYYGYFDRDKCYQYDSVTDNRFEPANVTADGYCSGEWSGNFLNWASMTRIDALRKILYGGKRDNQSAGDTETTLERSYIPTDAHSFAKHYDGSDISKLTPYSSEITLCNTTYASSGDSENITASPRIRVASGDYRYWAANERWQCTWDHEHGDSESGTNSTGSHTSDPSSASAGSAQYVARVQVCKPGLEEQNCQSYTSAGTTYSRPVGLLQRFGEGDQIHFGLLTGSYAKNKSGGVVRKNIGSFANEVAADGSFTGIDGIVSTLDKLRIANYRHDDGLYSGSDNCPWGISSFSEGSCSNWGNPVSEMYLEAVRYFAGLAANSSFTGDDTAYIPGLNRVASWTDPLDDDNRCASCNIIVINASDVSFDDDQLSMAGLPKGGSIALDAKTLTKLVGDKESITGNSYLVGETGTDNNQLCTAKTISNLGNVKGVCPTAPRMSGTYNIAGIGHWAHTNDIRQDLENDQTVTTYAVTLAPAVPVIKIPVPGSTRTVTILPACRNQGSSPDYTNCAIVDFKVLSQDLVAGTGSFYVNWEDSEQGGDYDQDMRGVINYTVSGSNITVTTDVKAESTSFKMGFGYVITGTENDGFHVHSGIHGFTYTGLSGVPECQTGCEVGDDPTSASYTIGSSAAGLLKDPLWYVAKYGGFKDYDDDGDPNETADSEWDVRDADGGSTPDGDPDNYFAVTDPEQLEARLEQVFDNILAKVSSGTAAAVVSNSAAGVGAVYQALYQPRTQNGAKSVVWTGFLHALFIDNKGYVREDSNSDGKLDGYDVDSIIEIYYDTGGQETLVQRYSTSDQGQTATATGIPVSLNALKPIWKAQDALASVTNVTTQRAYTDPAANGRHIITSIDDSAMAFDVASFTGADSLYHHLGVATTTEATNLVEFIRGKEGIAGYRSRTVDYDDDGIDEALRLGDIIHSSPVVVGKPNEIFAAAYGDYTYAAFRDKYQDRRQVLYVGANDGMLHAFNGGFWNSAANAFGTTPAGGDSNGDGVSDTAHPLGSELWGYVPQNLLPHLRWLPETDYPHVYYMDGAPIVFDANIFPSDAIHPGGWGTVLVAGMRLGGAPIDVDSNGDATIDYRARSAYVLLDVTDPEQPPTLIAEISHPGLGFTTSAPTVVKARQPEPPGNWGSPTQNDWYLVFGSGPTDLVSASSTQSAKAFVYDLNLRTMTLSSPIDIGETNSFVGGLTSTDWNNDFVDDATYFGTAGGTAATATGTLQRLVGATTYKLLDAGQPFVSAPLTRRGPDLERWIYAGTGRFYVQGDVSTTEQQAFYGVKEPVSGSTYTLGSVATSQLQNVTGIEVYKDGHIVDTGNVLPVTSPPIETYSDLESHMNTSKSGWYKLLPSDGTTPSTRNVTPAAQVSRAVLFSAYTPSTDACMPEGISTLYAVNYRAGVAEPYGPLGHTSVTNADGDVSELAAETSTPTSGLSSGPVVHNNTDGSKVFENFSTGELKGAGIALPPVSGGRMSWREIVL